MGWKNIKEHYKIGHIVQVNSDSEICIGSPYIHDIIKIVDGVLVQGYETDSWSPNKHLTRYTEEMRNDSAMLADLALSPDSFDESILVYTYKDGEIVEKYCEKLGWPNVTHDGRIMYENMFSTDKAQVIEWAIKDAQAGRRIADERRAEAYKDLKRWEQRLETAIHIVEKANQLKLTL